MIKKLCGKATHILKGKVAFYPYCSFNHTTKSIFIHIPKTAGTSVLQAIGAPTRGRKHISYEHYLRSDPVRFQTYFKFAVVRDPIDRIQSCYRYLINCGNQTNEDFSLRDQIVGETEGIDEFIKFFLTPSRLANWDMFRPQTYFICDRLGNCQVDLVLRFETLDQDFERLKDHISVILPNLPKSNVGPSLCRESLSDESVDKIRFFYKADYDAFYSE